MNWKTLGSLMDWFGLNVVAPAIPMLLGAAIVLLRGDDLLTSQLDETVLLVISMVACLTTRKHLITFDATVRPMSQVYVRLLMLLCFIDLLVLCVVYLENNYAYPGLGMESLLELDLELKQRLAGGLTVLSIAFSFALQWVYRFDIVKAKVQPNGPSPESSAESVAVDSQAYLARARAYEGKTLTDRARQAAFVPLRFLGRNLAALGVNPDAVTVLGLLLIGIASYFLATGDFAVAAIVLLLSFPLDAVDGAVARAMPHRIGFFGMVLDSSLDRYEDGLVLAGIGYYFASQDRLDMLVVALLAMLGSFLVSYVRARADDPIVAVSVKIGWFTRLERVVVVLAMIWGTALTGEIVFLEIGLVALAIGTTWTCLQRLWFVRGAVRERERDEAPQRR